MRQRLWIRLAFAAALAVVGHATVGTQRPDGNAKPSTPKSGYIAPRTANGQPDLEGVWTNNAGTLLERPAIVGNRALLTDEELAAVRKQATQRDGSIIGRRSSWIRRTALPPYTPQAQGRREAAAARGREHPPDGPEDRNYLDETLDGALVVEADERQHA